MTAIEKAIEYSIRGLLAAILLIIAAIFRAIEAGA